LLGARCQRLEELLRRALASRARYRLERDRAVARIRAVGDDFVSAFEAIDARAEAAIAAAELRGLLGHDLDVDSLLTFATEHLVARFRPANVAVWLCDSRGNHSLVAYGSNGTPRSRAEASLGIVGRELCPTLGTDNVATAIDRAEDMLREPLPGGGAFAGQRAIVVPVAHRGERFGAVLLVQPADHPWPINGLEQVGAIAAVMGEQVERIMRIAHHRRGEWPGGTGGE
jgi:hypothetical protein